jgi:peptidoglycan hydrolase-like protein with peptidoglycan-binding domain
MSWQNGGRIPRGAKETVVEKTDRPKQASGRSQAGKTAGPAAKRTAKKSARKAGKTAAAASKPEKTAARPAARKNRKRAATAVVEDRAVAKEELAARRIAGGRDTEAAASNPPENQRPNGIPAPAAGTDGGTAAAPGSVPSDPAPAEGQPEAAGRVPESRKWSKTAPRTRAGENAEGSPRPNTLVPTNGIHTTERRLKRKLYQNRGVMALIAATLLGIIILGEQTAPPNLTEFEQEIAASRTIETYAGRRLANSPPGIIKPRLRNESVAIPGPEPSKVSERQDKSLNDGELVEMERLLARLDLGPSTADGVVDNQTEAAIRLYQEIAGLPVDGAPSRPLLADIREVVKILEDGG